MLIGVLMEGILRSMQSWEEVEFRRWVFTDFLPSLELTEEEVQACYSLLDLPERS